jgi:hypothetical protein
MLSFLRSYVLDVFPGKHICVYIRARRPVGLVEAIAVDIEHVAFIAGEVVLHGVAGAVKAVPAPREERLNAMSIRSRYKMDNIRRTTTGLG